jgi:phage tail-like protein
VRPQGPTHWLLDGRTGWRTATADGIAVGTDLRLATTPSGPLGLAAEDGSLGGLVPPTGFALSADGICYLLDPNGAVVRRFDPERQEFVQVLGNTPTPPDDVTALGEVVAIAITDRLLYLADRRNHRVLVYGLPQLNLCHVWRRGWDLADVRSDGTATYLLDRAHAAVWRHRPHEDEAHLVLANAELAGRVTEVAVDTAGLIYLYEPERGLLHRSDGAVFTDPGELRSRFVAPPPRLVSGVFVLPESLTLHCGRSATPDRDADVAGPAFDRTGTPVPPPRASRGPAPYVKTGEWTSAVLDSRIYRCVWDRVRLDLSALPPGTSVEVETTTADDAETADWTPLGSETGRAHAPGTPPEAEDVDWPVRSRPGRYLAVRLRFSGPGRATPVLSALRVHYPRSSYLEFLPAIFSTDQDSEDFLERFLGSLQIEWDDLAARIADLPSFADPRAVPAGAALRFLAGWLGVPLDQRWTSDQQRGWLLASLSVPRRRGTPVALRTLLSALMANLTGIDLGSVGYPALVEGFRTRHRLELGQPGNAPTPLWSPDVVARLRIGSHTRVGQARLVSTGDPAHDFFTTTTDSFRVYLPSSWVRTAEDERAVHRLLTAERPATTQYQLCLVEPRLRVATQSTVGLDTVVGAVPSARLACRHDDTPPSRPPRHRLGLDTVLASAQPHRPVRVGPATRIGVGTGIR